MTRQITTIRPGVLVHLNVTIQGGVRYQVQTLDAPSQDATGEETARWETTRIVADKIEHDAAVNLRAKIRNSISGACCRVGAFGLMAPEADEGTLLERIEAGMAEARAWNRTARTCRVNVASMLGRVVDSDENAARAIRGEVRAMLDEVAAGIRAADPEAIRKACSAARDASRMLAPDQAAKVSAGLAEARRVARDMVSRIKSEGEGAADVLRTIKLADLRDARSAFLDLDDPDQLPDLDATPRALDLKAPAEADQVPATSPREIQEKEITRAAIQTGENFANQTTGRSFDLDL